MKETSGRPLSDSGADDVVLELICKLWAAKEREREREREESLDSARKFGKRRSRSENFPCAEGGISPSSSTRT